ncbi:MFS transporter [Pullulanibacillus camelliae]|uniref:MFS transporter n=1 Tax=Pullulanibacillus camelliae TaxID=1707096 RepID=A0A8J2YF47_9BACL|nr:MFS transporter [Pullulanibacillus camelliae]GGE27908.1 MFS transporter [Pullulanibacillus camelliae]
MSNNSIPQHIPRGRWFFVVPVAFIMYMISYMDRNNISFGFAGLEKDLGISATYVGLAAGIFFWGFMILQVPGGFWAQKFGTKKLISVCLFIWGILSISTGYVNNLTELLIVRFLLGTIEGVIWPSAMVLLGNWFPQKERTRANAFFMMGAPISSIIMAPLSGIILDWVGWREMFLFEGIPAIIWAVVWWFVIADKPSTAKWITKEEREYIENTLEEERKKIVNQPKNFREAAKNRNVLLLAATYFLGIMGLYGFSLWLPEIVKTVSDGSSNTVVGLITALPWISACLGLIICSSICDKTGKNKLMYTLTCVSAAVFLLILTFTGKNYPVISIICLTLINFSYAKNAAFWAIPSKILKGGVLGGATGFINAIGNLGGFFGPYLFGLMLTLTNSTKAGMIIFSIILLAAAFLVQLVRTSKETDPKLKSGTEEFKVS